MPSKKFEEAFQRLAERLENGSVMAKPARPQNQKERIAQLRWELPAIRRQNAIDSVWERILEERRERAAADDDPDAKLREWMWGEARRLEQRQNARKRQDELAARAVADTSIADAIGGKR